MKSSRIIRRAVSEKMLLAQIRELCSILGYRTYHTYNSMRSEPGFPDLVILGRGRLLFAELKSERGRLSSDQSVWLSELSASGCECYVWRPSDWHEIVKVLSNK